MERICRIGCLSYPYTHSLRTKANCRSNSNTFFSLLLSSRTIISHTKLPAIKHYLHLGRKTRSFLQKYPLYTPTLANVSPQIKKILCLEIMSFASGTVLSQNPSLHSYPRIYPLHYLLPPNKRHTPKIVIRQLFTKKCF